MSTNLPSTSFRDLAFVLHGIAGEGLARDGTRYAVDGLAPQFVATPASAAELAAVLAAANERQAAVIPWGGGFHMNLGNRPARYDVALRTGKLDRVIEHAPTDMTVTVEAGVTMERLAATLAEHGQFLPIDAPGGASVGGVLAAGVNGPSSHGYGLPRDWLLGCRVAQADGSVAKGGGRVVKNVAGYDLPKLSIGSLGTLGVVVEATFKVLPEPPAQETLVAAFPSLQEAASAAFVADERGLALRAIALLDGEMGRTATGMPASTASTALAAWWLAGLPAAVARTTREIAELCLGVETKRLEGAESDALWARLDPARAGGGEDVVMKASLPRSRVVGFVEHLAAAAAESGLAAATASFPTTGIVLARTTGGTSKQAAGFIEAARHHVTAADGSLVALAAPVTVKERVDIWGDAGGTFALMTRLKDQFDPRRTLSPGRFVGGL